jgi:hypothetical protein
MIGENSSQRVAKHEHHPVWFDDVKGRVVVVENTTDEWGYVRLDIEPCNPLSTCVI